MRFTMPWSRWRVRDDDATGGGCIPDSATEAAAADPVGDAAGLDIAGDAGPGAETPAAAEVEAAVGHDPAEELARAEHLVQELRVEVRREPVAEAALAEALDTRAEWLTQCGRPTEAMESGREATLLFRRLAAADPEHRGALAASLAIWSEALRQSGNLRAARKAVGESVTMLTELAEAEPDRYRRRLALALDTQARMLLSVEEADEAGRVAGAAMTLWDRLSEQSTDHSGCVGRAWVTLALCQQAQGEDPSDSAREALRRFDRLPEDALPLFAAEADAARRLTSA